MINATLVVGPSGSGKTGLIEAWRQRAPTDPPWAVLRDGAPVQLPTGSSEHPVDDQQPREGLWRPRPRNTIRDDQPAWLERFSACLCCTGRAVLPQGLVRLMRRGRWAHLLIELNGGGDPAAFIDLLRGPSLVGMIRLTEVVAVFDERRCESLDVHEASGRLDYWAASADRVCMRTVADLPSPALTRVWAQWASIREFDCRVDVWSPRTVPSLPATDPEANHSVLDTSESGHWRWRAPPVQVFDRRRLEKQLEAIGRAGTVSILRAAFRTERDWYAWRGVGAEETSDAWQPTRHRTASRIEWRVNAASACGSEADGARQIAQALEACQLGAA
ncbi:MAG: hypothetical protein RL322_2908 [Pseudomonadota bacterium]|jgi:hypothetical protein